MTTDSADTLPSITLPEWRPFPQERPAPRRSFAPPSAPRARRPLLSGGPAPTVIRNLDALFAADRARRSSRPPPPAPAAPPVVEPIDPKELAQALLRKVERDFGSVPPPPPALRVAPASPSDPTESRDPEARATLADEDEDEDLARLTPWYTRAFRALFPD